MKQISSEVCMKQISIERIWTFSLWLLFVGIAISLFFYSYNAAFNHDEFEHIHTAWKIAQGQRIFVDFFQHHHPFFNYSISLIMNVHPSNVELLFVLRYIMFLLILSILFVTYMLALRIYKSYEIGILSLILTTTFFAFFQRSIEIRPDVPQVLLGLLAIYFLFAYYDKNSFKNLILSAVFLAASFLFLQKTIVLIMPIGAILLYDLYKKRVPFRDVVLYVTVFVATCMPYYIYLLIDGSFEKYIETNWLSNLYTRQVTNKIVFVIEIFKENTVTCVLYVVGVIALIRSGRLWRFAALSLCLTILPIILFKNFWTQYIMQAAPIIAIITSYAFYSTFKTRLSRFIVILGAIYLPLAHMHNHGFFNMNNDVQKNQIEKVEYVLSITKEGDKVYDGNIEFNLFREDIDYFWSYTNAMNYYYIYRTDYLSDIYELIAANKPKVISNYNVPDLNYHVPDLNRRRIINLNDPKIKFGYKVSNRYQDIYIRTDNK